LIDFCCSFIVFIFFFFILLLVVFDWKNIKIGLAYCKRERS